MNVLLLHTKNTIPYHHHSTLQTSSSAKLSGKHFWRNSESLNNIIFKVAKKANDQEGRLSTTYLMVEHFDQILAVSLPFPQPLSSCFQFAQDSDWRGNVRTAFPNLCNFNEESSKHQYRILRLELAQCHLSLG
jgi:hypothetical protein